LGVFWLPWRHFGAEYLRLF